MIEIKQECYKGTRILLGNEKRTLINNMIKTLIANDYTEISLPIIQYQEVFKNKVGEENNNMMFNFTDRGDREICLAPEYTAIIQRLSNEYFKYKKDVKVFYIQECFRGERPQAGRYRQFTQLGVEILNPSKDYKEHLINLAHLLIDYYNKFEIETNTDATRGLDYYKEGKGFEITVESLGAQKQICGGGAYEGGIGFAIGIDRLLLINNKVE